MSDFILLSSDAAVTRHWSALFDRLEHAERSADLAAIDRQGAVIWVHLATTEQLTEIVASMQAARVVAISTHPADEEALLALDAGAVGYCHAYANRETLEQVAASVLAGGVWVGQALMRRLVDAVRPTLAADAKNPLLGQLTSREREVAEQVSSGASNREIADRLNISERTVKAHLTSIFAKLAVRDRMHLLLTMRNKPES